jgi:hypothetical protein
MPSPKAVRDLAGGVNSALRLHAGTAVQLAGEGVPARWFIKNGDGPSA